MANLMIMGNCTQGSHDHLGTQDVLSDFLNKSLYKELGRQVIDAYGATNFLTKADTNAPVIHIDRNALATFLSARIRKGKHRTTLADYALLYIMSNRGGYKVKEPYTLSSIEDYFNYAEQGAGEIQRLDQAFTRAIWLDLTRSLDNYLAKTKGPHIDVLRFAVHASRAKDCDQFISFISINAAVQLAGGALSFADKAAKYHEKPLEYIAESVEWETLPCSLNDLLLQKSMHSAGRTLRSYIVDELMHLEVPESAYIVMLSGLNYQGATPSDMKSAIFTDLPGEGAGKPAYEYAREQLALMMLKRAYRVFMLYLDQVS